MYDTSWKKMFRNDSLLDQDCCCKYCHAPLTRATATADHKVPVSRGGQTIRSNITAVCYDCNQAKGSMSEAKFLSLIKGDKPHGDFDLMRCWLRRKVFLRTDRACKHIKVAAGLE